MNPATPTPYKGVFGTGPGQVPLKIPHPLNAKAIEPYTIGKELNEVAEQLGIADKLISELTEKLQAILTPESEEVAVLTQETVFSPIQDRLANFARTAKINNARIQHLINRINL